LSLVLLTSVGLLVHGLWNVLSVDPVFRTENVLTFRVTPLGPKCSERGIDKHGFPVVSAYPDLIRVSRNRFVGSYLALIDLWVDHSSTPITERFFADRISPALPRVRPIENRMTATCAAYKGFAKVVAVASGGVKTDVRYSDRQSRTARQWRRRSCMSVQRP
jgi:hypothetical protein